MNDFLNFIDKTPSHPTSNIHIRLKQRNGKKCLTLIEGLASDLDLKRIAKALRQTFKTSGAVITTESGELIQLAGDHRESVKKFLIDYRIWDTEQDPVIKVHGFTAVNF